MYAISNSSHAEVLKLLSEMDGLKGKDNKTINARRMAKLMIVKLRKCKKVNVKQCAEKGGELSDGINEKTQ
jgi:glutamate 5-kinase